MLRSTRSSRAQPVIYSPSVKVVGGKTFNYELNKKRAVTKKLDASNRLDLKAEMKHGNLIMEFSAACYLNFNQLVKTHISGLKNTIIEVEPTVDWNGALTGECISVIPVSSAGRRGRQLYKINMFNTTSRAEINGHKVNEFLCELESIVELLQERGGMQIQNAQIRSMCLEFLQADPQSKRGVKDSAQMIQGADEASTKVVKLKLPHRGSTVCVKDCDEDDNVKRTDEMDISFTLASDTAGSIQLAIEPKDQPEELCNICGEVAEKDSVQCDTCSGWLHYGCERLTSKQIETVEEGDDLYVCSGCVQQSSEHSDKLIDSVVVPKDNNDISPVIHTTTIKHSAPPLRPRHAQIALLTSNNPGVNKEDTSKTRKGKKGDKTPPPPVDTCVNNSNVPDSPLYGADRAAYTLTWEHNLKEPEKTLKSKDRKLNERDLQQKELSNQYAACKALNVKLENHIKDLREENRLLKTTLLLETDQKMESQRPNIHSHHNCSGNVTQPADVLSLRMQMLDMEKQMLQLRQSLMDVHFDVKTANMYGAPVESRNHGQYGRQRPSETGMGQERGDPSQNETRPRRTRWDSGPKSTSDTSQGVYETESHPEADINKSVLKNSDRQSIIREVVFSMRTLEESNMKRRDQVQKKSRG
jgi:hypothetical protein